MPLYPKSFIQRLRDEIPVSSIVGTRVSLKKKGREFEACCPFHQEKSPSFFVNDQKGFYHCFGCSAHGDSIKFLMEYEKLTYPQAIEALAREAGISLPEISPEMVKQEQKRTSLQETVALAHNWFREQLQTSQGQEARDYLAGRGLTPETSQHFGIGYAPADRQALATYLHSKGATTEQMIEGGLLIQPDDRSRSPYSRFRDRVIFPITSAQGDVIAFGGRLMRKDENAPKYLNSPETPLFHKGNILYNWPNAKRALRDDMPIIVAEGYMDVIALHQYGFPTAVAPLGTALTENHLKGLWRYQDGPILCLDGDAAGQRAMWRSAQLCLPLLSPGKTLRFLTLPEGQDPDDFLKLNGSVSLQKQLEQTKPLSQIMLEVVTTRHGNQSPEQRAAAEAELDQLVNTIQHEGVKHHFRTYFREQRYAMRGSSKAGAKRYSSKMPPPPVPVQTPNRNSGLRNAQREIFKLLLLVPELMDDGEIANIVEQIECDDVRLTAIQHGLINGEVQNLTEAELLKNDNSIILPQAALQNHPKLLLMRMMDSVTLARIDQEIQHLQVALTEESLKQLEALKAEREALLSRQFDEAG
jgi:DNA primase